VDADTTINPRAVASALRYMDNGAAGGGAVVSVEGIVPLYIRLIALLPVIVVKFVGFTGGAFMFCTREAFHATGGFDERFYWGEEGAFAMALKREGRFVVLWERVLTSGRRFRKTSAFQLLAGGIRTAFSPVKMVTQRASVEKIWYDSNREDDDRMPSTPGAKVSNAVAFLIVIVALTGPIWNFIPWSLTPLDSPAGKCRFVIRVFLSHAGLVLWPIVILLLGSLLRRMQWMEWMKLAALTAFCWWQAWACTRAAIWVWTRF